MRYMTISLIIGLLVCMVQPVTASAADPLELVPLEPLPATGKAVPIPPPARRPGYNKRGRIDAVMGDKIIINDILRYLDSSTQIYSSSNTQSSRRILTPGKRVEYKMDKSNTINKIRILDR